MLTKLTIRNFKRFGEEVEIELGNPVVFIGPNNSGKTTAMQALALWDIGLRRWNEKWAGKRLPTRRLGVTVNRRDLVSIPVPAANLLWHELRIRKTRVVEKSKRPTNVRIDLIVEGVSDNQTWTCGLEFDYINEESFYCRPLRQIEDEPYNWMPVPEREVMGTQHIAFLPPMSGLVATETRLPSGAIDVRIGEGRTAEVLRNLCSKIYEENSTQWNKLVTQIQNLFGSELCAPQYVAERGEIVMDYREQGATLDLSSSGRGLQQTLLLLAYMYANPGAILLLDEPDAHLEILRQSQIYHLLIEVAEDNDSQIIAASHSEVLLNEAAGQDMAVAFVGQPHRIDGNSSQVLKALKEIGYEQYYQAEQTGWVLYLEGSTDLSILRAFAERLGHSEGKRALERPFKRYVGNQPSLMKSHFYGLKEAYRDLQGVALFDRLDYQLQDTEPIECLMWSKREIENYLCSMATLGSFARAMAEKASSGPIFVGAEASKYLNAMQEAVDEVQMALATLGKGSPWSDNVKASDEFLDPLFRAYFKRLNLPNPMAKKSFYELVKYVPDDEIDPEITDKLDAIVQVAQRAERLRIH